MKDIKVIRCKKSSGELCVKSGVKKEVQRYKCKECGSSFVPRDHKQEVLIKQLNPIIKGWSNYYKSVVSSKVFSFLDSNLFRKLWKWSSHRHPNKGKRWIKDKYFKRYKGDNWTFMTHQGIKLTCHKDHHIK